MISTKRGIGVIVFIAFCVILGVLLGVLLPRRHLNDDTDSILDLPESSPWYNNQEIKIFRQYLRIPTVHPNINYEPCVEFLRKQAASLDLPFSVHYPRDRLNPVVVITWKGSQPELSSIMLNSHTDVVPVFENLWSHPPFSADIDENGKIFGRGSQDVKALGMIYLAAIRALKLDGIKQLNRTFHVTFVPDEEMGGNYGMSPFVTSNEFKALHVGYVLDEARVAESNKLSVTNDERCTWRIEFVFKGVTGHGSLLFENTTGQKLNYVVSKLMQRREIEVVKLKAANSDYTNVTTINLTVMKGGVQANVIPPELSVTFDVRLGVSADHDEFQKDIENWCEEAGGNVTVNYMIKDPKVPATRADDTNPVWVVLNNTCREFGLEIAPSTTIGATDARYLRALNISAFGFSPIINTPRLLHDHDEYVGANEYLLAIDVYKKVISNLGNI
ncbi:Aminoacylase-1A [Pseudolycoriella hygida]|uniref:N-acyl-aliphatic-L-amino acid amidohydrolase n=1 Tax=Pseudolycoriella hygida TaxID=35572 RepID=A0A9Q0N6K6_9DIPT|nr:Aminoacylase-1A [Pseudolycoriella hygida]